jgi:hypothetical protein
LKSAGITGFQVVSQKRTLTALMFNPLMLFACKG